MRPIASLLLVLFCTGAVQADDDPPCACVAKGKRFAQGDSICMNGKTLTCSMQGNVSSWIASTAVCAPVQAGKWTPLPKA